MTSSMRRTIVLMAALVLVFALAACGSNNEGGEPSSSPGASASPSASDSAPPAKDPDPVTLKIITWTNEPVIAALEEINKKFHEKYPYITVNMAHVPSGATGYDALQDTRLLAKDVDLMANNAIAARPQEWAKGSAQPRWLQWVEAGTLDDISSYDVLNQYTPESVKDACTYDGKVYCVNTGAVPFTGVFYNKDTFAKYNLQVPKTWSELEQVVKTLQDNKELAMTFGAKDGWPIALFSEGIVGSMYPDMVEANQKLWSGELKYTDPEQKVYWERLQEMLNWMEPNWQGIDYTTVVQRFGSGAVAMLPDGVWQAPAILQVNPDIHMGYFPLPASDNAANNEALMGKYDLSWFVPSASKNKEAAQLWLEFFSENDQYQAFIDASGFVPVQDDIEPQMAFMANEIVPQMPKFKLAQETLWQGPTNAGKYAGFAPDYIAPKGDIKTVDEMADLAQKDWDAAIKALQ